MSTGGQSGVFQLLAIFRSVHRHVKNRWCRVPVDGQEVVPIRTRQESMLVNMGGAKDGAISLRLGNTYQ